jgi:Mrp family chromosome partitioning ATPase
MPAPEAANTWRVLHYLRLHWLMILFCGSLLGGVAAYAAWQLLASKYESYALLQVSSVPAALANQNNPAQARTDFVTYLKTTAALLRSEFVLNAALRDIRDLPTIRNQKDPIKFLDEELIVQWQDGSEVVRVAFKSRDPQDARRIVDAVQKAFMAEVIQKDVQEKQLFLRKVEEAQLELRKILERKAERPLAAREGGEGAGAGAGPHLPAGGPNPAGAGRGDNALPVPPVLPAGMAGGMPVPPAGAGPSPGPGAAGGAPPAPNTGLIPAAALLPAEPAGWDRLIRSNPAIVVNKVTALIQEVERLPIEINHAQRRLAILREKMESIKNAPVSDITLQMVEKDPEVMAQVQRTRQALREYEFRRNAAADPEAPKLRELKASYEAHEAALAALRKEKADALERNRRLAEAQKVAAEMEEVIRTIQRLQEQLDTAKALLARTERQLVHLPLGEKVAEGAEGRIYRPELSDLDSTDGIYRRLVQQYYLTRLELDSPPRVRVIQSASTPIQRDMKKQIVGTIFAGLMGFVLVAAGVIAVETMAQRISSLQDVRQATPLPVVGVIPGQAEAVFARSASERAAAVEAVDKLRAYVSQAYLTRGATVIGLTSALQDDGKAVVAVALAASIAHTGLRTLLVDCDLRRGQLHRLIGVENHNGVSEWLRGETDATAAIRSLTGGLHFLPAGRWTEEVRAAATGERLSQLLAAWKGSFDCVIVHNHALLAAAEALEVGRRCDVLLVCCQYRQTTVPLLKRVAERILQLEAPSSGIVYVGASAAESLC